MITAGGDELQRSVEAIVGHRTSIRNDAFGLPFPCNFQSSNSNQTIT
jgi:hypothetical protein